MKFKSTFMFLYIIHNILVLEELNKRWKIDESRRFSSGNACKSELEFTCLTKYAAQVRTVIAM